MDALFRNWARRSTFAVALTLAGCSHSMSGVYVSSGPRYAEMLSLTSLNDGQLLGSLNLMTVQQGGEISRRNFNISGVSDGKSITLAVKAAEPLSIPVNLSGTVDGDAIVLTGENGTDRLVRANVNEFQNRVQTLASEADTMRARAADQAREQEQARQSAMQQAAEQQKLTSDNQRVAALAEALSGYAARVQAHHDTSPFKNAHAKLLAAAQHDLDTSNGFPKGSLQASQIAARVGMLNAQLDQIDASYRQTIETGRSHIADFDTAISRNPCQTQGDALGACNRERAAEKAYRAAKAIVQRELDELATGIQRDEAAMQQIVDATNSHASS